MSQVFSFLSLLCSVYLFVLFARVILDWILVFNRAWQPRGVLLVVANVIYALTDPPVNALRGVIPPLRLGTIALDVGFLIIVFGVLFAERGFALLAFYFR